MLVGVIDGVLVRVEVLVGAVPVFVDVLVGVLVPVEVLVGGI